MPRFTSFVFILILLLSISLLAQTTGDYRTKASGNWSAAQNWERYNGSTWAAIGTPPTGAETSTVQSGDSIFIDAAVFISGKLVNQWKVEANGLLTIANGGTYEHARNRGSMPLANWAEGSTLLMSAVQDTAPDDRDQNYYNITFNCPDQVANLNMNLDSNTVSGDIRVINTGLNRWYLTSATANDSAVVTILGDVIVEAGTFATQGTSNALTKFTVHHYGDIIVTGGNFSLARGSQPNGSTTWYLYEGNFSMSNATTQCSTNPPGNANFIFCKAGRQTLTLGEGNTLTALFIKVNDGTTLDMGASVLAGSGNFTLSTGATLATTVAGGLTGIFSTVTGVVSLANASSFEFNGSAAQVTSALMPDTVTNLTINNTAGVVLSQSTTIMGVLRLMVAGEFDNTIPFILGPNGSISYEGGSLKVPVSALEDMPRYIPNTFFVLQNFPNPFNPSTTIRFGLPTVSDVTVKVFNVQGQEIATLFEGRKGAGVHNVEFDASNLSSGVYLYRIQAGENVEVKRMLLIK